ncbi:MAG: hypothetical protein J7K61_01845 [Thermoplasmata archaeon]|nr:hypothetical protein [Thermoplasmata archaeon]
MKFIAAAIAILLIFPSYVAFERDARAEPLKLDERWSYIYVEGKPALPYKTDVYVFPAGSKINGVKFSVNNIHPVNIKLPPSPQMASLDGKIVRNLASYPNTWYDYRVARGIWKGEPSLFLSIFIYPYRIDNGSIVKADIDYTIDYRMGSLPVNENYKLLIITTSDMKSAFETLASFKNSNGIKTMVMTTNEISSSYDGRDVQEKIKHAIEDAVENYGIEYVILGGDAEKIPVRYVSTSIGDVPADLYYADVYKSNGEFSTWDDNGNGVYGESRDGMDFMPDVYLSRLPASNSGDASILVDKIIHYSPPPGRAMFTGNELFPDTENVEGEYLKEQIADEISPFPVIRLYETNTYEKDGGATSDEIAAAINNGVMFVNFASHGYPGGMVWHTGGWEINDLNKLHNGYTLPIVFAMACSTNRFDDTDCIGEEFLLKSNGGAIAYVGSSRVAYVYLGETISKALSGYLDMAFFKAYYDGAGSTGEMFTMAKEDYIIHAMMSSTDRLTVEEFNMLGDPSIQLQPMEGTSRAYTDTNIAKNKVDVYATVYGSTDVNVSLYYRTKSYFGVGQWHYYGTSSYPYHWVFYPDRDGWYEFCSAVNGSEKLPDVADTYCIFDNTPPEIKIEKPLKGHLYIFNRDISPIRNNNTIVIGKIDLNASAEDTFMDRVEFYVDGHLEKSDKSEPYSMEWRGIIGWYEIKAIAYDRVGNEASSSIRVFAII